MYSETVTPSTQEELAAAVRACMGDGVAVYPVGGGAALDFGLVPKQAGVGLSLLGLNRVIDYPARDMTITVEAGITMQTLAETLAVEGQRLPIDVPEPERATLGGMIATNFSGPRRFGCGTLRDYVIGVSAVDGRGTPFKGGGRVVKNVAGYDFCKLLTGSLGTLGVIPQVTLKVKPIPEADAFVACVPTDFAEAERLLAAFVTSPTTPTAIELSTGPGAGSTGALKLLIGFEGTRTEVDWLTDSLQNEWRAQGAKQISTTTEKTETAAGWQQLTDIAAVGAAPALAVKFTVPPSRVCELMRRLVQQDATCVLQARAGTGVVLAQFSQTPAAGVASLMIQQLRPAAQACGGHAIVWRAKQPEDLTRQAWWGGGRGDQPWMQAVKQQFDPRGLLNPGRFFYGV